MSPAEFDPTISAGKQSHTYALESADNGADPN